MPGIGQFAFEVIVSLVASAIQAGVELTTLPYFQRRKIERRFEDATAEVVEPLLPFLEQERVPQDKQRRLIETCVDELRPLTKQPELFFQGSLDGQKIFDNLYADRDLPQVVVEDDLKDVYALLCPRIATLLCKIPAAVKDWENEAWTENYRRLDEITAQMRSLFIKIDEMATASSQEADATLTLVRRTLAQRIGLKLDLTGLRADQPQEGRFTDFFVYPKLQERKTKNPRTVESPDEGFAQFTSGRYRAILIGPPGAGKSIWSKWLQRETVSARWTGIGVRVALRGISGESLPSLQELVREEAGKHLAEELTPDLIRQWLKARQVVFILDGFDEIRPDERDDVLDWIVDLGAAARGCPFVLTSRPPDDQSPGPSERGLAKLDSGTVRQRANRGLYPTLVRAHTAASGR
jgi:hypothetical protein